MKPFTFIILVFVVCGCASGVNNQHEKNYSGLVNSLRGMPIEGLNIGPARGVMPNDTTKEIVNAGKVVVPYLIKALSDDDLNEVIYSVYCLQKMGAPEKARPAVLRLQMDLAEKKRFNFPRDLTLEIQIKYFIQEAVQRHIAAQARQMEARENPTVRMVAVGDLDGDGIEDVAVVYTFEGSHHGNGYEQYLAVSSSRQGSGFFDVRVGGKGVRAVDGVKITAGRVELVLREYAPSDASCCPSRPARTSYILKNEVLFEDGLK